MPGKLENFLKKIEKQYGSLPEDLHVTRKAGALVAISEGKVIFVGKPTIKYCPLFKALFDAGKIDRLTIRKKFETQFEKWGMFTCDRIVVEDKIIVPFGASEMMMYSLKRKIIDVAVLVCEGAGTVITDNPDLVQGIGAYMNGVFYTSPIREIIEKITGSSGIILNSDCAGINQYDGVMLAVEKGFKKITVTVRGDQAEVIDKIRKFANQHCGEIDIIILAVCNTGINKKQAKIIKNNADIVWACASKQVWEEIALEAILQIGMKIPVFILTKKGIRFISGYSSYEKLKDIDDFTKKHYITLNKYETGGIKINMGRFSVYLYETPGLPVHTSDEPTPFC